MIDGKVYDVNNGDLFYMNQFEAHKITFLPDSEIERYILQVHPEFMLAFSTEKTNLSGCFYRKDKYNKISLDKENLSFFIKIFSALEDNYDFADDVVKQSLALLLLAKLNELSSGSGGENIFFHTDKSLKIAMEYIDNNFKDNITLDTVARKTYVSVTQLCRLFKNNLGTTPSKYITSKRISEAKKMLRRGFSVSDTAYECGFNDYSNFIRTFSSHVGISPGKYAKTFK